MNTTTFNHPVQTRETDYIYNFHLPKSLQCSTPTEERDLKRDEARLMVSYRNNDMVHHGIFRNIIDYLEAGDVLVVNTSGTLKAALSAIWNKKIALNIHLSNKISDHEWVIELREVANQEIKRFSKAQTGDLLQLSHGGAVQLIVPYYQHENSVHSEHLQLWKAAFLIENSVEEYLDNYGKPIRYNYIKTQYPPSYYQTVFATEMGSTEMPSAGRAFTPELVAALVSKGVQIVPILLHTGVASLEIDERPYDEYFRVPSITAEVVNRAKKQGRRVIAVGTTVVRALETVSNEWGQIHAREGWTDTYITPQRGICVADGLVTGFHEPRASHLLMLETLAGRRHLQVSYEAAVENGYMWHEFGDLHLILP